MHSGEVCDIMTVICSEPYYPLPGEGGSGSSSCSTGDTEANPVTHLPPPSMGEGDRDSGGRGPRQRHIKLIAEDDTFPSEPSEPFEPFEPGPPPQPSARQGRRPFLHNPPPSGGHNLRGEALSTFTPKGRVPKNQ